MSRKVRFKRQKHKTVSRYVSESSQRFWSANFILLDKILEFKRQKLRPYITSQSLNFFQTHKYKFLQLSSTFSITQPQMRTLFRMQTPHSFLTTFNPNFKQCIRRNLVTNLKKIIEAKYSIRKLIQKNNMSSTLSYNKITSAAVFRWRVCSRTLFPNSKNLKERVRWWYQVNQRSIKKVRHSRLSTNW